MARHSAGLKAALLAADGWDRLCRTQLSHDPSSFVEDQADNVVDEVGKRDLRLRTSDADSADDLAIWSFCRANTCSMRARTVDLAALARAVRGNRYERPTLTGLAWLESGFSEFRCFERLYPPG